MKRFLLIFILTNLYGQESVLIPNINPDARELVHYIEGDRIILSSEFFIHKVEIFNSNTTKSFEVSGKELQIPISDLPLGRYTVAVFVNRKIIAITLLRQKEYKKKAIESDTIYHKKLIEKRIVIVMQEEIKVTYDTIWLKVEQPKDIIVREIPYDLTNKDNDFRIIKQSRKRYRQTHLRPNGTKYQ